MEVVTSDAASQKAVETEAGPSIAPPNADGNGSSSTTATTSQSPDPYHSNSANFPPGKDRRDFVSFGHLKQASYHQGIYWPMNITLRNNIIVGEVDYNELRRMRLTSE